MNKNISRLIVRYNETISLRGIEPRPRSRVLCQSRKNGLSNQHNVTPATYHLTVPLLRSANREDAWRPAKPGANPEATTKVERKVSAVNFMVRLLRGLLVSSLWLCDQKSFFRGVVRWNQRGPPKRSTVSLNDDVLSDKICGVLTQLKRDIGISTIRQNPPRRKEIKKNRTLASCVNNYVVVNK